MCLGPAHSIGAVSRLVANFQQLVLADGSVDTQSGPGFHATTRFVESLEEAAVALRLQPADRSYRANFSVNYQALFSDYSRQYRVDILEASLVQTAAIWVNGDKFEFSQEAMMRAEMLKQCWTNVTVTLEKWNHPGTRQRAKQLRGALRTLDTAWAAFEHKYINELMAIEARPRMLMMAAIENEQKLQDLETKHRHQQVATRPEYMDAQTSLVQKISHLNSIANVHRKGRTDLSVEILWDAVKIIESCEVAEKNGENTEKLSAARVLSGEVVASFQAMRNYFREISRCLERVDPQLRNNAGLVRNLVRWEEAWEVGKHYVQNEMILSGICDLVAEIRQAQLITPDLKSMCADCNVELFMVLPRILWLRGLAKPAVHLHLFKSLLPHRFPSTKQSTSTCQEQWPCDAELNTFIKQFRIVSALLESACYSASRVANVSAWEVLVKRVVFGSESKARQDVYGAVSSSVREQAEQAVESLMNKMERWSIEIQRHHAEDWNMFTAIIARCLAGGSKEDSNASALQV
eukprot:TRINITY_DN11991_c0_g4_i1.p1 TRINITY_DN11991_c0_g4~~TRINITY_DN11991_c0_g4_i1.p1  ORF type:complete len:546 (+),score=99.11 TRINITY_DN11991_c0_g4_i1:78-1640(+)